MPRTSRMDGTTNSAGIWTKARKYFVQILSRTRWASFKTWKWSKKCISRNQLWNAFWKGMFFICNMCCVLCVIWIGLWFCWLHVAYVVCVLNWLMVLCYHWYKIQRFCYNRWKFHVFLILSLCSNFFKFFHSAIVSRKIILKIGPLFKKFSSLKNYCTQLKPGFEYITSSRFLKISIK